MIDAYFRPLYQQCLVKPIQKWSKDAAPFTLTSLSCCFGILVVPALYLGLKITAVLMLLISSYIDSLTGSAVTDKAHFTPSILDIIGSRIVECAVVIGLYVMDPVNRGIFSLVILSSCYIYMSCYLIVALYTPNQDANRFQYSPKLIERTEALLFFVAMILFPSYFFQLSFIFTVLLLATSYSYIHEFLKFNHPVSA